MTSPPFNRPAIEARLAKIHPDVIAAIEALEPGSRDPKHQMILDLRACLAEIDRLAAEVSRLRGALEQIVGYASADDWCDSGVPMQGIAEAALSRTDG